MTYQMCVFDIDGVLNPAGAPVQKESITAIKKLETKKLKISFASGKHPWYITGGLVFSGLLREDTIIIGETGGHVFFPSQKKSLLYTEYLQDVKKLKKIVYQDEVFEYPFWEEPKETLFTVFPRDWDTIPYFEDVLQKIIEKERLNLYTIAHVDALDTIQAGLSKKVGLKILCKHTGISLDEMIAFGDGMNDLEMLSCVGYPVAVANAEDKIKDVVTDRGGYISRSKYGKGVLEAVDYILENIL
jgi:HAD superfamily hydrolase (TIGR01484 family)